MKRRRILLSVCLLAMCTGRAYSSPIQIPIEIRNDHVYVRAKLRDRDVLLMIDTGTSNTVVTPAAIGIMKFELLNMPMIPLIEVHSQTDVHVGQFELKIGKARVNAIVVLTDLGREHQKLCKCDGLLGQQVLTQFSSVRIDYKHKILELE